MKSNSYSLKKTSTRSIRDQQIEQNRVAWNDRFNELKQEGMYLFQMTFVYKTNNVFIESLENMNKNLDMIIKNYLYKELLGANWRRPSKQYLVPLCVGYIDDAKQELQYGVTVERSGVLLDIENTRHHHCVIAIHPDLIHEFERFIGLDTFLIDGNKYTKAIRNSFVQELDTSTTMYDSKSAKKYPDFMVYGGFTRDLPPEPQKKTLHDISAASLSRLSSARQHAAIAAG